MKSLRCTVGSLYFFLVWPAFFPEHTQNMDAHEATLSELISYGSASLNQCPCRPARPSETNADGLWMSKKAASKWHGTKKNMVKIKFPIAASCFFFCNNYIIVAVCRVWFMTDSTLFYWPVRFAFGQRTLLRKNAISGTLHGCKVKKCQQWGITMGKRLEQESGRTFWCILVEWPILMHFKPMLDSKNGNCSYRERLWNAKTAVPG